MTGAGGGPSPARGLPLGCGCLHTMTSRPPVDVWVPALGPVWSHPIWHRQSPKVASMPHLQDLGEGLAT